MKLFRNLLKGSTLATALFIFQACYGTPSWLKDTAIEFKVVSAQDNKPIDHVGVYTRVSQAENLDWNLCGYTDENGIVQTFVAYDARVSPEFRFEVEGGIYQVKDTVIADMTPRTIEIKLSETGIAQ